MKSNQMLLLLVTLMLTQVQAADKPVQTPKEILPAEQPEPTPVDNQVIITEEQYTNLGIVVGPLESVKAVPVLYAPGRVIIPPEKDYIVSAAQAGLITKFNAAIGDRVAQGQVLAIINSPELLALQRQYLKAASELQLADAVYRRDKKLSAEGVISNSRFDETRSRYVVANSEAKEAEQLLRIAGMSEAAIEKLAGRRKLSSQLEVYSPITGVVLDKMAAIGARVSGQTPLYRVADIEQLWLELNIPQQRIGELQVGDQVRVDGSSASAEISLLGQSVNPQNQTILARAIITNGQDQLRPGQSVNAQIIKPADKAAFKVPNDAIAQREGQSYIFIRNAQGFRVKPVHVIGKQHAESIIRGDLADNEMIAIRGGVALKASWMGLGSEE